MLPRYPGLAFLIGSLIALHLVAQGGDHSSGTKDLHKVAAQASLPPVLRCTPLEALLRKDGNSIPQTDADWNVLFEQIEGTGPDVYFSVSNAKTDLSQPLKQLEV